MKTKSIAGLALAVAALTSAASARASSFYEFKNLVGCGKITSIRDVDQAPLYDALYEAKHGSNRGVVESALSLTPLGLFGNTAAMVAGTAIEMARGPSSKVEGVKAPASGKWEGIQAIQVTMDSGEVLNLPLTAPEKGVLNGPKYEVGKIVPIYMLTEFDSIQVSLKAAGNMTEDDYVAKKGRYGLFCKMRVSAEDAAKVFAAGATAVQESKIIDP